MRVITRQCSQSVGGWTIHRRDHWDPLGRRGREGGYDSGSFFLLPDPWVKATTSSRLRRASFSSTLCT